LKIQLDVPSAIDIIYNHNIVVIMRVEQKLAVGVSVLVTAIGGYSIKHGVAIGQKCDQQPEACDVKTINNSLDDELLGGVLILSAIGLQGVNLIVSGSQQDNREIASRTPEDPPTL
jgi:hypothetical protein